MLLHSRNLSLQAGENAYPSWEIDLHLEKEDRLAVVGESGGGKTSLAWALMGRPLPGQMVLGGDVFFHGKSLFALSQRKRADLYYRHIALVPQNAQNTFHPAQALWKSAREVAQKSKGAELYRAGLYREDIMDLLEPLSRPLDLSLFLWTRYPHQLSGGQKQRMALVLALLNEPELLLLDEPTNALDEYTRENVIAFMHEWISAHHAAAVIFTHDIALAAGWATRIAVLYRGEIVEEIPAEIPGVALHPYTVGLLDAAIRLGDPPLRRNSISGHALPVTSPPECCNFCNRCSHAMERCWRERPGMQSLDGHKVRCFR